jgi:hypothetical protein
MHVLPLPATDSRERPMAAAGASAMETPQPAVAEAAWLYRSEGFAEDLEADPAHEPLPDPPLLRWGLPMIALVGVVGLAAAFTLV